MLMFIIFKKTLPVWYSFTKIPSKLCFHFAWTTFPCSTATVSIGSIKSSSKYLMNWWECSKIWLPSYKSDLHFVFCKSSTDPKIHFPWRTLTAPPSLVDRKVGDTPFFNLEQDAPTCFQKTLSPPADASEASLSHTVTRTSKFMHTSSAHDHKNPPKRSWNIRTRLPLWEGWIYTASSSASKK